METFFSALGVLALTVVILVAAVALFAWYKIRKFIKGLKSFALGPDTITLERATVEWQSPDDISAARVFLEDRGYQHIGDFEVEEMERLIMAAFANERDVAVAVAYEYPGAGFWVDLVQKYNNGKSVTVTNATVGDELDHQPGHKKVYLPSESLETIYSRFQSEKSTDQAVSINANNFKNIFEKAYADEMKWRKEKGVSTDEIDRVAHGMEARERADAVGQ